MMWTPPTMLTRAATAAALMTLIAAGPAQAGSIIPLDQQRSTGTFVNADQCSVEFFSDGEVAPDFGPFDSFVSTEHSCDSGAGLASAAQESAIDEAALTGVGFACSEAHGPVLGVVHAFGNSTFDVTFELESECAFALDGLLSARASDDPLFVLVGATISLEGPEGDVFDHVVEPGKGGKRNSLELDEAGVLAPGVYRLRATADTVVKAEVPPSVCADASFDFTFEVGAPCREDLDGSGAVDFGDILAVLSAWGNLGGPEDLDGSGVVDFGDIVVVLAAWGPCE